MTKRLAVQGLQPSAQYAVQLRAIGDSGAVSEWSQRLIFTTLADTILPNTPGSVTWVVSGDSFHGEWNPVTTNADGDVIAITRYEVELIGGGVTKIVSVTPQTTAGKVVYDLAFEENRALFGSAQPTVTFRVRAVDDKELKSAFSGVLSATNPSPAAPTAPAVGSTATGGSGQIDLAWTPPADTDLIGYNVYVGGSAGFTPAPANRIYSGNSTRFVYQTGTTTIQYFKIRAVDKFAQESVDLAASATAVSPANVDVTAPAVPTGLAASIANNANGLDSYALVSWNAVAASDLAGYSLRYRKAGTSDNYTVNTVDKDTVSLRQELPAAYQNYEFAVRAFDWSANYSSWSGAVTATSPANTVPSNVTGLTSTAGNNSITYNWTQVADTDIKNYELTFSTSPTFASGNTTFLNGTSTNLTVGGLDPSTNYYARVRAVDTAGLVSAAWSSTDTETTGITVLSDALAPGVPTAPVLSASLGALFATWTPVTLNSSGGAQKDAVTYEVHVATSAGGTYTKVGETSGTFAMLEKDGAGAALAYGTTYYVKVLAKDRDGSSALSPASNGVAPAKAASGDISATGRELGSTITTTSTTAPGSPLTGDIWNDTTSGFQKSWNGSSWVLTGLATIEYTKAKGTDLVVNGTGAMGTNYNFSAFTFDKTDVPTGAVGAFDTALGQTGAFYVDEIIPVDPSKKLKFSFQAKQKGTSVDGRAYAFVTAYDAYKQQIAPQHVMYQANTLTTLAVQLNPGDTTITLTSGANWYGSAGKPAGGATHYRSIIWWDYVDAGGKAWEPLTYSRNWSGSSYWADGGVVGNVITLAAPYSGPVRTAGTQLSNGSAGGTFMYSSLANQAPGSGGITTEWTTFTSTIVGYSPPGQSPDMNTGWPIGTAYCKIGWLPNRSPGTPYIDAASRHSFASVSLSDAAAAQQDVAGAIKTYITEYSVNASETVAPVSGWSTSTPVRTPGTFVWFRTTVTRADTTTSTTSPALLTGNTGATGPQGAPAAQVDLTATTQVLSSPAGGGATNPTTSVVTGVATNTTITQYDYSVDGAVFAGTVPAGVSRSGNVVTITGGTMTAKTITVRMRDAAGIGDTMTVAKVSDGATGGTGSPGTNGTDAYTVLLTNEAQVFPGSTSAATAGSATTSVIAYKGTVQQTATIGTITGQVTGLTTAITNNGTTNPTVTVTVTTGLVTQNGTLTIPVTTNGITFNKLFSWSVAYTGATGSTGSQGIQGPVGPNGATLYTWIKYADTPTTGMNDLPAGKTYMGIAYNKSSATESSVYSDYEWSLIAGADGKGISSTAVTYQTHSNGTTPPTGTWQASPTATTAGQFLWTRTITTYTDATTSPAYSVSAHGATGSTGAPGTDGKGISGTAVTYQVHSNGTTAPTGTWLASPAATSPGQFLWTRTVTTYTDATTVTSYSIAAHGNTGAQGVQGPVGPDGNPTYTWIKYGTSAAGAGLNDSPVGMTYMGIAYNKTTPTESTTATDYEWSLIQGPQGPAGTPAAQVDLIATAQVLTSPSGGGATTPATSTVTGTGTNTTITQYDYSVDGAVFAGTVPAGVSRTGNVVTITGSTMTARTIAVRMRDAAGIGDTLTVAKAFDGATGPTGGTGGTGAPGADAYTVLLTNESQTFAAGTTNANATTATSTVVAYKGNTQQTATVGTITGGATGISAAVTNNGTTAPLITFTVTTALTTPNGTFTIPVTVAGVTFNQIFSWSLSFTGNTGSTGSTGAPGAPAGNIDLTSTTQVLASPSGGGVTTPATAVVTGTANNTTITVYEYSVDGGGFSNTVPTGASSTGNVVTITGSTMTARTITVRMADAAGIVDTLTVAKTFDGATGSTGGTGGTGPAGADAYTVLLTNESQAFAAGTTNAQAATATATVVAYKGNVQQTATVGTITGGATGITAAVTNNGTTAPLITFTVTTALATANGTFTIPVTVGGITFPQIFSWSLAFTGSQGNTGSTGSQGAPGVGVSGTAVTYQVGSSGSVAPVGTWQSTPQVTTAGQFLWTRTITTYTDASNATAYSVAAHGATGSTGSTGSTGAPGVGVSGTTVTYQVGASGTTAPVSTWQSTPQATTTGQFLWTRTITNYTDSSSVTSYSISAHGATGSTGSAGTSATSVQVGNDAVAIPVSPAGAALSAGTITIPFSGWVGSTRTAATISASGLPAGITLGTNTAATSGADGSLLLNYANGATIGAADTGNITLTVTCNSQTFTQLFSWTRAYAGTPGSTGGTGSAGTSATSLDKTPDNFLIPTDAAGNASSTGSVVVNLKGLVGATASNVTIGTAPGLPAGVSATPSGSGTTNAFITFNWTSGANIGGAASSGTFTWPITVNGITFSVNIGWARATQGATGSQGNTGTAGANAEVINLTATSQILASPAGGGATTPATSVVSGSTINTTIGYWEYSTDGAAFTTTPPTGVSRSTNDVTITGSTFAGKTLTVRMSKSNGSAIADTLTVAKTSDGATGSTGSTGGTGPAGADAYTVLLDNEAQVFPGSTNAALDGSAATKVIAYKAAVQQAATIGTIPTLPTGMTAAITNNGTTTATVTFTVAPSLVTQSGTVLIPITVGGIAFTKAFAWNVAYAGSQGPTGPTGGTGSAGVSVTAIAPYFGQVTTGAAAPTKPANGTVTPSAPWVATEPTYVGGTELYRTEKISYSDGSIIYTTVSKVSSYDAAAAAMTAANGKNKVTHSTGTPGSTANTVGDIWIQVDDFTNNRIIAQWRGAGTTTWVSETIRSEFIAYLDAQKISANSTFTNALNVKSTFTLGDAVTPGIIKSYNYNQASKLGFSLGSNGLEIWNGKVSANTLEAGTTITQNLGVTGTLTISSTGSVQSSNYNGTTIGWKIDASGAAFLDANSTIKAEAIKAGVLGGSSGSGLIDIANGTSLRFNGGQMRSNTYNGSYVVTGGTAPGTYYAAVPPANGTTQNGGTVGSRQDANAGFYLGNDGLVIAQGIVKAEAFAGGTFNAGNIIMGAGGSITGGTWTLNSSGLTIPNGGISAASLNIQIGQNIMPAIYADFESNPAAYTGKFFFESGSAINSVNTTGGKFGPQKYGAVWSSQASVVRIYMGSSATDYNIAVEAGKTYIFSMYVWSGYAQNATLKVKWSNGTTTTLNSQTTSSTDNASAAIRLVGSATAPAGVTGAVLAYENTTINNAGGMSIDGIQVEEKFSNATTASTWTPPAFTSINGGQIRTGEMRSNVTATINGVTQPLWSINVDGYAQFTGAAIRGNTVVGSDVTDADQSYIQSFNFVPGSRGWIIRADGTAEFRDITTGSITPGAIGAGSLVSEIAMTTGGSISGTSATNKYAITIDGINYSSAAGIPLVALPMDGTPALFTGNIVSSSVKVSDNFNLSGVGNILTAGSKLILENALAGITPPANPTINYSWDSINSWWDSTSDLTGTPQGFHYNATDAKYTFIDNFFGPTLCQTNTDGSFFTTIDLKAMESTAGGYISQSAWSYGAVSDATNFYFLVKNGTAYQIVKKPKLNIATVASNAVLVATLNAAVGWRGIGMDASGNLYVVGRTSTAFIAYQKWTTAGVSSAMVTTTLGSPNSFNEFSIQVGNFDFGSEHVVIGCKSTGAHGSVTAANYVFTSTTATSTDNNKQFPSPDSKFVATTWDGSNFRTFNGDGLIYKHTATWYATGPVPSLQVAAAFTAATAYAGSYAYSATTATGSLSASKQMVRRAKVTVAIPGSIPTPFGGAGDPTVTQFYLTAGSSIYGTNSPTTANATVQTFEVTPNTTGATLPTNTFSSAVFSPALITSANGKLELNADGYGMFGATQDATTAAGNKPALRVGNPAGNHLRVDGNEIISMAGDATTDVLHLQAYANSPGVRLGINNKPVRSLDFGTRTDTPNGSGTVTIPHSLGITPTFCVVTPDDTSNAVVFRVIGMSSTNINLKCVNQTTNAVITSGARTFYYFIGA